MVEITNKIPKLSGTFRNLWPDASEAVPALIEILEREPTHQHDIRYSDIRYSTVEALVRIGFAASAAIPALLKIWHSDAPKSLRFVTAFELSELDPENPVIVPAMIEIVTQTASSYERNRALRTISMLGPVAAPIMPTLIDELKAKNAETLPPVLAAISALGPEAADAVPALIDLLDSTETSSMIKTLIVRALGSIGPQAKSAVSALTNLADRTDGIDKRLITNALSRMDHDAMLDVNQTAP